MTGRGWLGFCAAGVALASGYRGDWVLAGVAAVVALVPAVLWLRCEWTAAAAVLRVPLDPEPPPPAPRLKLMPCHPPWETAPVPVIPSVAGCGGLEVAGRHRKDRGLRDAVADTLRAAAQVRLP